ncbi:hypothetical protein [Tunturiibacter gelidiferens]|uniref:hypothetical protein n=1 Tax=Tunturiibacter gelidiferens TaxID=3069689 RepID=UPI003D9B38E6
MSFQLRDETAGIDIMFVNNSNQMGLGSLPVNGQALTVNSFGIVSPLAIFGNLLAVPGVPLANTGSVNISPGGSTGITVVSIVVPTVTASQAPSSVTTTTITWTNASGFTITVTYGTW